MITFEFEGAHSTGGQILQKNPGRGQTPHPGNVWILGTNGPAFHPLAIVFFGMFH